jgi:hypothetical protein
MRRSVLYEKNTYQGNKQSSVMMVKRVKEIKYDIHYSPVLQ